MTSINHPHDVSLPVYENNCLPYKALWDSLIPYTFISHCSPFKYFSFLLLLLLFSISMQINVRESQFLAKSPTPSSTTTILRKSHSFPTRRITQKQPKEQEQEPTFIPDTQQGYGLYNHERASFLPTVHATIFPTLNIQTTTTITPTMPSNKR